MFAAGIALELGLEPFTAASPYEDPFAETFIDEVPVDVVVNRLTVALRHGKSGILHAVAGRRKRLSTGTVWQALNKERKLFWMLGYKWQKVDWHSPSLHLFSRIYVVLGTAYEFDEARTDDMWASMSEKERIQYPLYMQSTICDLSTRRAATNANILAILKMKGWPQWVSIFVCRMVPSQALPWPCRWLEAMLRGKLF